MKLQPFILPSALLIGLSASAPAQNFTKVYLEGEIFPPGPGEFVSRVDTIDVNNSGSWVCELDTDGPSNLDQYVSHNGTVIWQSGTSIGISSPPGILAGSFVDVVDINDAGDVMLTFPAVTMSGGNVSMLVRNGTTIIQSNATVCNAPGLAPGSTYFTVDEAWQNNNNQILIGCKIAEPGFSGLNCMILMTVDAAGAIVSEQLLARQLDTLPGHASPVSGFSFFNSRHAINDAGQYLWMVDDSHSPPGSQATDTNYYLGSTLLYNEADPFPLDPMLSFDDFGTAEVDLNGLGHYVMAIDVDGPTANDLHLFKVEGGVITMIANEGELAPPSMIGGWSIEGSTFGGRVKLSDNGDVMWYLNTNNPDLTTDTALMRNQDVVMQEGITMVDGMLVFDPPSTIFEMQMSNNGQWIGCEVGFPGGIEGAYLIDFGPPILAPFCSPASPNSTGQAVILSGSLTGSASSGLHLEATGGPPSDFGYFLVGTGVNTASPIIVDNGMLCLSVGSGQSIGRYNLASGNLGSVGMFDASGTLEHLQGNSSTGYGYDVPTNLPLPGSQSISAGQTWYFQLWYRDTGTGGASNLSDGLTYTF